MKYLVDVNVLSEGMRSAANRRVISWLRGNEKLLVVDSIIIGEVLVGIRTLPPGRKRANLELWFATTIETIQCLAWDAKAAKRWASLTAELQQKGKRIPLLDSMIAATALVQDLTVATRNTRDFKVAGVKVFDPFES